MAIVPSSWPRRPNASLCWRARERFPVRRKSSSKRRARQWNAATTLVSLHFDPPLPPLVPDKRSKLVLHVQGSEQALRILVENRTPGVLRFLRGDRQELLTSGGAQNSAEVAVQAITTGDFSFHARILARARR